MLWLLLFMTATPFYGPNIIVILESELVNKNGLVQGEGDRVIIVRYIMDLFHVLGHWQLFFSSCKIDYFAAGATLPAPSWKVPQK